MVTNCIFIGFEAGEDVTDGYGLVIIGDYIRSMPEGATIIIGETVFGVECNLAQILRDYSEGKDSQ